MFTFSVCANCPGFWEPLISLHHSHHEFTLLTRISFLDLNYLTFKIPLFAFISLWLSLPCKSLNMQVLGVNYSITVIWLSKKRHDDDEHWLSFRQREHQTHSECFFHSLTSKLCCENRIQTSNNRKWPLNTSFYEYEETRGGKQGWRMQTILFYLKLLNCVWPSSFVSFGWLINIKTTMSHLFFYHLSLYANEVYFLKQSDDASCPKCYFLI